MCSRYVTPFIYSFSFNCFIYNVGFTHNRNRPLLQMCRQRQTGRYQQSSKLVEKIFFIFYLNITFLYTYKEFKIRGYKII